MNPKLLDFLDRVGWTFVHGLAGAVAADETASTLHAFDWRAALSGAAVAAAMAALKVAGVNAGVLAKVGASPKVVEDAEQLLADLEPAPTPAPSSAPPPPAAPVQTQFMPAVPHLTPPSASPGAVSAKAAAEAAGSL